MKNYHSDVLALINHMLNYYCLKSTAHRPTRSNVVIQAANTNVENPLELIQRGVE